MYSLLLQTGTLCTIYYHKQITHNIPNPSQHSGSHLYRQVLALESPHFTGTVHYCIAVQVTVTTSSD